ncbi:MAG: hypothetical protein WDN67_01255 [Candidatus Moraniibacteriota bacterium]
MTLPYLKVEPELGISVIEECIVSGYKLKDQINEKYLKLRSEGSEDISVLNQLVFEWRDKVIGSLTTVFVSERELYNFRDARASALARIGISIKMNSLNNRLEAWIDKLNEYDRYIREQFSVHIEFIGRDKNSIIGNDSES